MPDDDPLLDALRAVDPVDPDRLPGHADAAPAALLKETIMSTAETHLHRPSRRWLVPVAAAIALFAAVGGAVVVANNNSVEDVSSATNPDTNVGGISPGGSLASCVEAYDLTTLTNRETAFSGSVTSVSGDRVTFRVDEWFRGGDSAEVNLTSSTGGAITPDGGTAFEPGARLLVAGDGGFAWACGYTQPYDKAVAADWAEAFRS